MKIVYFVWAILPLALIWITVGSLWNRLVKNPGHDSISSYVGQTVFCSLGLVVAILVDQYWFHSFFADYLANQWIDSTAVSWLIYPAVLAIGAGFQQLYDKRGKEDVAKPHFH